MEERLRFYEEGIAPSKNADAMQVHASFQSLLSLSSTLTVRALESCPTITDFASVKGNLKCLNCQ